MTKIISMESRYVLLRARDMMLTSGRTTTSLDGQTILTLPIL